MIRPRRGRARGPGRRRALFAAAGLALLGSLAGGCTCHLRAAPGLFVQHSLKEPLPGDSPKLCLVKPLHPRHPPRLILLATGDAGFLGTSKVVFGSLAREGFYVAGISSRSYLENVRRETEILFPDLLARDFSTLIDDAERSMGLPADTPTILVGVSRGAGFVVVAAGQEALRPRLAGAVAVGLTKHTDYVRHRHRRRENPGEPEKEQARIRTYAYLQQALGLPVAVIQSTHDGYLPAAEARRLFGPDTATRRLYAVESSSHGFRGGREILLRDLDASLAWIDSFPPR